MRKDMEEEIRSQLLANQEMLAGAEGTGMSWEEKVREREGADGTGMSWEGKVILLFRLDKCSVSLNKIKHQLRVYNFQ